MSEAPKFTSGDWNPFESLRGKISSKSNLEGHGAVTGRHLKNALAFQAQHHRNVMEYQSEGYRLEGEHQAKLSGLQERASVGEHSRTLELHGAINKAAEGGTGIKVAFPSGMSAEYTKAKPKARPKKSSTASFPPVKVAEEPQIEHSPISAPSMQKTQKFAHRDPVSKKITGYKDYPQEPLKATAAKKKAAPKKKTR